MQRRDPRSFLEGVMAKVPDIPEAMRELLLESVAEKSGTKRGSRLAAVLGGETNLPAIAVAPPPPPPKAAPAAPDSEPPPPAPVAAAPVVEEEAPAAAPAAKPKRTRKAKAAKAPAVVDKTNPFMNEISDDE